MEHISNLINTASLSVKREEDKYNTTLDPHVTAIVNKLFGFFLSICRGFNKQYYDEKKLNLEKTQWIRAFMDVGLNSLEKIQLGVKKCRLESPINTPTIGQFLKWCTPTPEELGIPDVERAYLEACQNSSAYLEEKKWTHQAIYHAWSMCNSFELANSPKQKSFPLFERNYEITVKMMMRGEPLKDIPLAITHDKDSEPKKKIANGFEKCNSRASAMEAIRQVLGNKIDASSHHGRM